MLPVPLTNDDWGGVWGLADTASLGWCLREFEKLRYEGRYTPPSLQGSLAFPATAGGMQWGGGAVDPETGIYYINSLERGAGLSPDRARGIRHRPAAAARPAAGLSRCTARLTGSG